MRRQINRSGCTHQAPMPPDTCQQGPAGPHHSRPVRKRQQSSIIILCQSNTFRALAMPGSALCSNAMLLRPAPTTNSRLAARTEPRTRPSCCSARRCPALPTHCRGNALDCRLGYSYTALKSSPDRCNSTFPAPAAPAVSHKIMSAPAPRHMPGAVQPTPVLACPASPRLTVWVRAAAR